MQSSPVVYDERQPIGTISIRRNERRNALNERVWGGLRAALERAAENPPHVLLLHGEGGHFSVGSDLRPDCEVTQRIAPAVLEGRAELAREIILELKSVIGLLGSFPCPTIAAIEGNCIGGGLEIAAACDIRVGAEDSLLGLPELKIGLIPDLGGTVRLTRLLGRGLATELILTGRLITGVEAHRVGLLNRLAASGSALRDAQALATEMLSSGPRASLFALQIIRQSLDLPLAQALDLETEGGVSAMTSGEAIEGITAFLEKRPPHWRTQE